MAKSLLPVSSLKEHYAAEACVIWCFDNRFRRALQEFAAAVKLEPYDLVMVAGGAKPLASPDDEAERDYVLKQVGTSLRLHHAKKVVLMLHSDCGAYGGLKAFGDNPETELEKQKQKLATAKNTVTEYLAANSLPNVPIETVFVDFGMVWEV